MWSILNKTVLTYHTLFVHLQKIIEEVEEMLNNLPGVTSVHGRFYDLSSKYYRIIGNHAAYYKDALRYLGCVDLKDLPGGTTYIIGIIPDYCQLELKAESCSFHRDGEAGEGVHAGSGWTPWRRSLQLWRAGEIFTDLYVLCLCFGVCVCYHVLTWHTRWFPF